MKHTPRQLSRREAIGLIGAAGAALTAACGDDPTSPTPISGSPTTPTTPSPGPSTCVVTPTETVGPFPTMGDFLRGDIREGRPGIPLTLIITVVNASRACAAVVGAQVGVWQCDAAGDYSQYGTARAQTYLRGIQITDVAGSVTFTTIYPGWYQGRATHVHVEVVNQGRSVKVTQLAFPEDVTAAVYRTGVYAAKGPNPLGNAADGVFRDGFADELVMLRGDTTTGFTGTIQIGVEL